MKISVLQEVLTYLKRKKVQNMFIDSYSDYVFLFSTELSVLFILNEKGLNLLQVHL